MKRKVASIALSVAILGGGIAGAIPANAASAPTTNAAYQKGLSLFDADIKKAKEKLRIEKITRIGDKTVGTANDKKAREFHEKARAAEAKFMTFSCESESLREIGRAIKPKSASEYQVKKTAEDKSKASYKYASIQRDYLRSYSSQSDYLAKFGNTFSYQKRVFEKFTVSLKDKGACESVTYKTAKSYTDKVSKSLSVESKREINKTLDVLKKRSDSIEYRYITQVQPRNTKDVASYTHYKNIEVAKADKKVKSLEKAKADYIKKHGKK